MFRHLIIVSRKNVFNHQRRNFTNSLRLSSAKSEVVKNTETATSQPQREQFDCISGKLTEESTRTPKFNIIDYVEELDLIKDKNNGDRQILRQITKNSQLLTGFGVTKIVENKTLLFLPTGDLKMKLEIIASMKPKCMDDFVPLAAMKMDHLRTIKIVSAVEAKYIPGSHRIYYFSNELKLDPMTVSQYFATHKFMFDIDFKVLQKKLEILKEYDIASINILRDLDVFQRSLNVILSRLQFIRSKDIKIIMPWMIKCLQHVLDRSIAIRTDAGKGTSINYLAKHLNWSDVTVKQMLKRYPYFDRLSTRKVRDMYQLLTQQLGITDVTKYLPFFKMAPRTFLYRYLELKSLGKLENYTSLCKSTKDFKIYIDKLRQREEQKKNGNKI